MMISLTHDIQSYLHNIILKLSSTTACLNKFRLQHAHLILLNPEVSLVETIVRSKIPQIFTLEQTLIHQGNKLAIIMQIYQLHTVKELATRQ